MNDQYQRNTTFQYVYTNKQILAVQLSQAPIYRQNPLGTGTMEAGLQYESGTILARVTNTSFDGGYAFVNCDPASADPEKSVAYAVLLQDSLPINDNVGTGVVGLNVYAVKYGAVLYADQLQATLADKSDVNAAMTSMGATFDPITNTYSLGNK